VRDLVIWGAVLLVVFIGLCALFAWLVNDWMKDDEDAAAGKATDDSRASQTDDF
jgi:hypothetical protein